MCCDEVPRIEPRLSPEKASVNCVSLLFLLLRTCNHECRFPAPDVELYSSTALHTTALYSPAALKRSTLYILYTLPQGGSWRGHTLLTVTLPPSIEEDLRCSRSCSRLCGRERCQVRRSSPRLRRVRLSINSASLGENGARECRDSRKRVCVRGGSGGGVGPIVWETPRGVRWDAAPSCLRRVSPPPRPQREHLPCVHARAQPHRRAGAQPDAMADSRRASGGRISGGPDTAASRREPAVDSASQLLILVEQLRQRIPLRHASLARGHGRVSRGQLVSWSRWPLVKGAAGQGGPPPDASLPVPTGSERACRKARPTIPPEWSNPVWV